MPQVKLTSERKKSTPGTLNKELNYSRAQASAAANMTAPGPLPTPQPSPIISILFVLMGIGHVFELKVLELGDFNEK